jgi:hypothetical protein
LWLLCHQRDAPQTPKLTPPAYINALETAAKAPNRNQLNSTIRIHLSSLKQRPRLPTRLRSSRTLLTIRAEAEIISPAPGSKAATVATIEDGGGSDGETYGELYIDDYDGIDWGRIPRFAKPHRMLGTRQSWIYRHGYRVSDLKTMKKIFWLCKYCHQHKITDVTGKGLFDVTRATSTAINHLAEDKPGHLTTKLGVWPPPRSVVSGQKSLKMAMDGGLRISQAVVNTVGNFDVHAFRTAVVQWLVDNNCQTELRGRSREASGLCS